jgi:hypothetical protein
MIALNTPVFATLTFLACQLSAQCEGCYYEDYTWGGGSVQHIYTYTPGPADQEGTCDPSTCEQSPCIYSGSLHVTNNGTGAIDIHDSDNAYLATLLAGRSADYAIAAKSYCGVGDEQDPWWHAEPAGGGAAVSGYVFSCSVCTT